MVSAAIVERSLRGAAALLVRRSEGLAEFDVSEEGFWASFRAILLTAPAYIVTLALVRRHAGLAGGLFNEPGLALLVGVAHLSQFVALPVLMIPICRRRGLDRGYVPFVVATNWIDVFADLALALPGVLLLVGLETGPLTRLFVLGFGVLVLHVRWFTARATLGIGPVPAALVTASGLGLDLAISAALQLAVGS